MALTSAAPVCWLLWLLIQRTQPSLSHSTLFWTERKDDMLFRLHSPWERGQGKKKKKKERAKREGTFPCPLLHGCRVIVYWKKQDHVSEPDNKAWRPARRQEKGWLDVSHGVCFCACKLVCICVQHTGEHAAWVIIWPYYIDADTTQ